MVVPTKNILSLVKKLFSGFNLYRIQKIFKEILKAKKTLPNYTENCKHRSLNM